MKSYSDSTLKSFTKDQLIDIIRCLENNYSVQKDVAENQYNILMKYMTLHKDDLPNEDGPYTVHVKRWSSISDEYVYDCFVTDFFRGRFMNLPKSTEHPATFLGWQEIIPYDFNEKTSIPDYSWHYGEDRPTDENLLYEVIFDNEIEDPELLHWSNESKCFGNFESLDHVELDGCPKEFYFVGVDEDEYKVTAWRVYNEPYIHDLTHVNLDEEVIENAKEYL